MKRPLSILALAAFGVLFAVGCTFSRQKGGDEGAFGNLACQPIGFDQIQSSVLSNCTTCHSTNNPTDGISVSTYEQVTQNQLFLRLEDAVINNRMPKSGPLSASLKQMLSAWIDQGQPRTAAEAVVSADCASGGTVLEANYESLRAGVLAAKCIGCHDADNKYDFTTYETLISKTEIFVTPEKGYSKFIASLVSGDMPLGGKALPASQIQVFDDWIRAGVPEVAGGPPGIDIGTAPPPVGLPPVPPTPGGDPNQPAECIDFQFVSQNILTKSCTACHGGAGNVNLQSYGNVKQHLVAIEKVINQGLMPPKNPLAGAAKTQLLSWIQNGAPELAPANCAAPPPVTLEPLKATYNSMKEHFFQAKCISCHNSASKKKPDFSTYQKMMTYKGLFDFEKPHKSEIVDVVLDGEMPPPASGVAPLTQIEIDTMIDWIKNGLPEG